jgi:alpha-tubulin suppressor-like RCC1 family protein
VFPTLHALSPIQRQLRSRWTWIAGLLLALGALVPAVAPTTAAEPSADGLRLISQVSAGYTHTCAVLLNGTAACWGNDDVGQIAPPVDAKYKRVNAGGYLHSCGLQTDGVISCWGGDSDGQARRPDGLFIDVTTGSYHSCGVRAEGNLACWGKPDDGRTAPPEGTFTQVSAGESNACALRTNGSLACWGKADHERNAAPQGTFLDVSVGDSHACAIRSDSTVACWGNSADGRTTPPDGAFMRVASGYSHACGLRTDRTVSCWGSNTYREASPPQGTFLDVSAGYLHSCGLRTEGVVECWGWDSEGQATQVPPESVFGLPLVDTGDRFSCARYPDSKGACFGTNELGQEDPPADAALAIVSTGDAFGCGLTANGTARCWGDNAVGQATPPSDVLVDLSSGGAHACGLKTNRTVVCWGANDAAQATPPEGAYQHLSAGGRHTCAVRFDGAVTCWGDNAFGQAVPPAGEFRTVNAGRAHTCGVRSDGSVACWGDNALGQAGPPGDRFTEVSAGAGHTCGVRADGSVACWGDNALGQAGPPGDRFFEVSAGAGHSCGVRSDGILDCWGNDDAGQSSPPIPGAPTLEQPIPDQLATEDTEFAFAFPDTTFADEGPMTFTVTLADGSPIPAWLRFDPNSRRFSGMPQDEDVGSLAVTVTATGQDQLAFGDTFTLEIANSNDPPRQANQVPGQKTAEDQAFNLALPPDSFIDDDIDSGDVLALNATREDGSALPTWLAFDPVSATFIGTPLSADVGQVRLRVTATDAANTQAEQMFAIDVINANDTPTVAAAIPNQAAPEDADFSFMFPEETFGDEDGDKLTYEALRQDGTPLPVWLKFDAGKRSLSGKPADADVGQLLLAITARDPSNASVVAPFAIDVTDTNDPPALAVQLTDQAATQATAWTWTVPIETFTDPDTDSGDLFSWGAKLSDGSPLPAWLSLDAATGTFSGTPADGDVGSLSIDVTATDRGGVSAGDSFALTVANVNDPPTVAQPIPDQLAEEATPFQFTVPDFAFSDPDLDSGETLAFSGSVEGGGPLPGWLVFDPSTRTLAGTPTTTDIGVLPVAITVADVSGATATDVFAVTISELNDDPTAPSLSLRRAGAISASGEIPVIVDWTEGAEAQQGRPMYRVEYRKDGTAKYKRLGQARGRSVVNKFLPEGRWQLRLQATTSGGAPGPWIEAEPRTISLVEDSSDAITWHGSWRKVSDKRTTGKSARESSTSDATATWSGSATAIGVVATTTTRDAAFEVCLDAGTPGEVCRVVDMTGRKPQYRHITVGIDSLPLAAHTLRVRVLEGSMLLDAIAVME